MRVVYALAIALLALVLPAHGQGGDTPWQASITGQIEALRAGDDEAALELAGASFKRQFSDPAVFFATIIAAGYGPIATSRTHSFGEFTRSTETEAVQTVRLVGTDQRLYEAIYQVRDEPDAGWRIYGVVLRRLEGLGI